MRWPVGAMSALVPSLTGFYFLMCVRFDMMTRQSEMVPEQEEEEEEGRSSGSRTRGARGVPEKPRTSRGMATNPCLGFIFGLSSMFIGVASFLFNACGGCDQGVNAMVMSVFACVAMLILILLYEISSVCQESSVDVVRHGAWVLQSAESFKACLCVVVWVCLLPLWAHWESLLWLGSRDKMLTLLLASALVVVAMLMALLALLFQSSVPIQSFAHAFLCVGAVAMAVLWFASWHMVTSDTWCDEARPLHVAFHISLAITLLCLHCFLRTLNCAKRGKNKPAWATLLLAEPASQPN